MATWLLMLFLLAACGASARDKTLRAALVTVDAARVGLEAYDPQHQVQIAREVHARGGTREEAIAAQDKWREQRDAIYRLMIKAYAVLVVAVENNDAPLDPVRAAVSELVKKLVDNGVPVGAKGSP